jgi:lipid II:glycine glycyltransferase (peptidoglycan interpeptide bridge formation enzyme)
MKFILVKTKDGYVVSGVTLALFKNQAYYFRAGSDEQYFVCRVNNLALWNGIKFAKEAGYEIFNIGIIYPFKNPNAKGVELKEFLVGEFKKQFGKTFVPVFEGKKYLK